MHTVTIFTPGHTPDTQSYAFTLLDSGKPLNVAYSRDTAFNSVNNTPDPGIRNFQIDIQSQRRMASKAAATGATVMLSNHSEFADAANKNRMLTITIRWSGLTLRGSQADEATRRHRNGALK